ncbi:MAG: thioesterase [Pseudonocardiales bacterium]|nr:MAG: thioesterase [Pseudonocardiales bacterium]
MTDATQTPRHGGRWLIRRVRRPDAAAHLYCFAHAGGAPGEYVRWADDLPEIQVWAVQPPGRASRLAERPFTRMTALVEAVVDQVTFEGPFALFGHSLGALVAFEVARSIRARGLPGPVRLFASSCSAPTAIRTTKRLHLLSDADLLAEIERRWGPMPAEARSDPLLLETALGCYRADFALLDAYEYVQSGPLECPITVLVGDREPGRARAIAWRAQATGPFDLHTLPGGHLYFRESRRELCELLRWTMNSDLGERCERGSTQ